MVVKPQSPTSNPGVSRFTAAALSSFQKLDRNGDTLLSPDEVTQSLLNPSLRGESAAVVATLYRERSRSGGLARLSNDQWGPEHGISRGDLEALPSGPLERPLEKRYQECHRAAADYSPQLFASDPLAGSIRQGDVADCWWLAPLAGQAAVDPQSLQESIQTRDDGQYQVTFPDGRRVEIDPPTPAECATFATSGSSGHWLTALEKARGEANQGWLRDSLPQLILSGGSLCQGIRQATGDSAEQDWLLLTSKQTTRAKMAQHLNDGDLVVAATGPGMVPRLTGHGHHLQGLVSLHAYTVLGFDPETDSVSLRNPWGDTEWKTAKDDKDDGEFSMPFDDFHGLFCNVAYQQG